ncbi:aldehyde dehydrogenase [Rhodococcus erythropolis]|uniref:aldehyde dehydrogenase n=1 Tax=Rhodococcus erythropolis TaxID=1833 RepID=UPI002227A491|nr:aldehyde dehydrogenase [Rhodococcus erythropolis]MCW2295365.1 acyl-CoA reductase-like NAD-dependent aldehyde dehydrogenase [Rhodococcus erythropolis]
MTNARGKVSPLRGPEQIFLGGKWTVPSGVEAFDVVDATTEEPFQRLPLANGTDVSAAIGAARHAFDLGPWPRMRHGERAEYLRRFAQEIRARADQIQQVYPRETGVLYAFAQGMTSAAAQAWDYYADLGDTYEFETSAAPTAGGDLGLLVREPVGVVGAIVPWNSPIVTIAYKLAPALIAGCTVILKASTEAPIEAYIMAEIADDIGLPEGVFNMLVADREVSEILVRDPRVDKITFTGSTAAGRRIASLCGDRIARTTLELGGKSAALILDDADIEAAAAALSASSCAISGQVCSALTRIIVPRPRHDDLLAALASNAAAVQLGDPFDDATQMGPLAVERQRDRVESFVARGIEEGATLAAGGRRPQQLARGWFIEPTVFGNVDNASTLATEEIFGPVLSVIPADSEDHAIELANDSIYGLNASVFTPDPDRALSVARRLRTGTVGHNSFRSDFGVSFGGFKQSGIGREGGREGIASFLETKYIILDEK